MRSNALAHPYFDERTAAPADTLPKQVVSFVKFVQDEGSADDR